MNELDVELGRTLVARGQAIYATAQIDPQSGRAELIGEVDTLLGSAKTHNTEPIVIGQLLRYATLMRMVEDNAEPAALPLLEQYESYTRQQGLVALYADSKALRAKRELASGRTDGAITVIAKALAVLDDNDKAPQQQDEALRRLLGIALVDVSVVLTALGIFEAADQTVRRAKEVAEELGDSHLQHVLNGNRVFLLVDWGRRLERLGYPDTARQNFIKASMLAKQIEAGHGGIATDGDESHPMVHDARFVCAHAYANPGSQHYAKLRAQLDAARSVHEQLEAALPLARCMEREGDYLGGVRVLTSAAQRAEHERVPYPLLHTSVQRELARLTELAELRPRLAPVDDYIHHLEQKLWELREANVMTLNTRREHELLTKVHGTVSAQAMQDPLTELPNRRALDERLAAVTGDPRCFPLSIALIDLDGFKRVNDEFSHARGDDVLRAVAAALRDVLREDDLIARHGGDEFVAVLSGAPPHAAQAAMARALNAVRGLPWTTTLGVSLSIGVVSVERDEPPASALSRADAAMYSAKRRGGDAMVLEAS